MILQMSLQAPDFIYERCFGSGSLRGVYLREASGEKSTRVIFFKEVSSLRIVTIPEENGGGKALRFSHGRVFHTLSNFSEFLAEYELWCSSYGESAEIIESAVSQVISEVNKRNESVLKEFQNMISSMSNGVVGLVENLRTINEILRLPEDK